MLNKREKMGLENENQDRQDYAMHETFKVLGRIAGRNVFSLLEVSSKLELHVERLLFHSKSLK